MSQKRRIYGNSDNIIHHYPPDLLQLLIDTIPLLCRRKKDTVTFFARAGIRGPVLNNLTNRVHTDPDKISKYEIARTLLVFLNEQGEAALRERREVLKRVTQWEDFSICWPDDQLKARGLVAQIQRLVQVKDTFTRIDQERDAEKKLRLTEERAKHDQIQKHQKELKAIKKDLSALFTQPNPQKRGKALEAVLNRLFAASGMLVRDVFTLRACESEDVVGQIDGLVEIDMRLFLVEMKWWNTPVGKGDIAPHIVRLYSRPEAHGIFISASAYTEPAVAMCREAISQGKILVLCELREIVLLLVQGQDVKDFFKKRSMLPSFIRTHSIRQFNRTLGNYSSYSMLSGNFGGVTMSGPLVRAESMPIGIRWFAEYQPFTPIIDTLRGLLLGTPIGNSAILAVAWCVGLAIVGYMLARAIYNRDPVR